MEDRDRGGGIRWDRFHTGVLAARQPGYWAACRCVRSGRHRDCRAVVGPVPEADRRRTGGHGRGYRKGRGDGRCYCQHWRQAPRCRWRVSTGRADRGRLCGRCWKHCQYRCRHQLNEAIREGRGAFAMRLWRRRRSAVEGKGPSKGPDIHVAVTETGDAVAEDGSTAVTGSLASAAAVASLGPVSNTGQAQALAGSVANSGTLVVGQLTVSAAAVAALPVPHQLPPRVGGFQDRAAALSTLNARLCRRRVKRGPRTADQKRVTA